MTQPANQFRLGVYWVITTLFAFSPWAAELIRFLVVNWQWMQPRYRGQSFLERVFDAADLDPWLLGMLWLGSVLLIWPWLTLLTLRVFRDSMQQKRIKDIHVVRCIVYSFDLTAWLGAMIAIGTLADIKIEAGPRTNALLFLSGLALFILFILVCLWLAFRIYLRFDHAFRTIATTQIMVFLLGANVLAIVFRQRLFFRRFWLFWE